TEPEYNDTARKVRPASLFRPLTQCLDEAFMHTSTPGPGRLFPDVGKNVAPQSGLPALVRLQKMRPPPAAELILACRPVGQPIGPVHLILVEKVGQALSELITLAQISVIGEETDQRLID